MYALRGAQNAANQGAGDGGGADAACVAAFRAGDCGRSHVGGPLRLGIFIDAGGHGDGGAGSDGPCESPDLHDRSDTCFLGQRDG